MFSRDPKFNQALAQLHDVLLKAPPKPEVAVTGQTLDDGHLEVIGFGLAQGAKLAPESKADVHVYYTAHARSGIAYKFQLIAWPVDSLDGGGLPAGSAAEGRRGSSEEQPPRTPIPSGAVRVPPHLTADGAFPSDRWRPGEYVRDRFKLAVPGTWHGAGVAFGLVAIDPDGHKAPALGAAASGEPNVMILGVLPFAAPPQAGSGAGSGSGSSAPAKP
jgi:hypothetical protein